MALSRRRDGAVDVFSWCGASGLRFLSADEYLGQCDGVGT